MIRDNKNTHDTSDDEDYDEDEDEDLGYEGYLEDEAFDDDLDSNDFDGVLEDDAGANDHLVEAMMNDLGVVSLCYFHLYFSTAGQRPLFADELLHSEVQHQLSRVCKRLCCPEYGISVSSDHAHILCRLHPEVSLDDLVKRFKSDTQEWLLERQPEMGPRIWQENYGGCSVSGSEVGKMRRYLDEEPERHQLESYEDEFRRLCAELGIEIEEPDCWQ
jgi:putative transposase